MLLTHNFRALPLIFSSFATSTYARRTEKSEKQEEKRERKARSRHLYVTIRHGTKA